MPKKLSIEEIDKNIKDKHGETITVTKYGTNTYDANSDFLCNVCGYTWTTCLYSVMHGCGCKMCGFKKSASKNRNTIEYVKNYISERGCELLDDTYINNETPIKIRFECGHIHSIRFGNFERGCRCPECGRNRIPDFSRLPKEEIVRRVESCNLIFIEFVDGYQNNQSKIRFACKRGHINETNVMCFTANPGCRKCSIERRAQARMGDKHPLWRGTQKLRIFLMQQITEWKLKIMKDCSFKCIFTGSKDFQIHHIHNFNAIIDEALENLNLQRKLKNGDYTAEELELVVKEVQKLHELYPSVCLRKDLHKMFHKIYGTKRNTIEQFEEFKNKIQNKEIIIEKDAAIKYG